MLLALDPVRASVVFEFNYLDAAGQGFNDATLGATRRAALEDVANNYIGQQLGFYNVRIQMDVLASEFDGTGALASAGPYYFTGPNGFARGFVGDHIQTGTDPLGGTPDGTVQFDFGYTWDYTTSAPGGSFSFRSVVLHELTHALGFSSMLAADGSGLNGNTDGDVYTTFDSFLETAGGTALIAAGGDFTESTVGSLTSEVYFNGANANALNGGNRVRVHTPGTFNPGSSLSHLDNLFTNDVMLSGIAAGQNRLAWSAVDVGILRDLGYVVLPEPHIDAMAILGLAIVLYVVRRRVSARL